MTEPHSPKVEVFDIADGTNTDPKGVVRLVDDYREEPFGLYLARPTPGRVQFWYLQSWLLPDFGLRVTQFSFNPGAVAEWDRQLQANGITLPVHLGIAGPTPLAKLLKFAAMCGIGASLGALWKNMGNMTKLATGMAMAPDEMLLAILANGAGTPPSRLVQPHYYAFGGVMETAQWLRHLIDGTFTMDPSGEKFTVNA